MKKEYRMLPKNTFVVYTDRSVIFVDAKSHLEAESKTIALGFKTASSYQSVEVFL